MIRHTIFTIFGLFLFIGLHAQASSKTLIKTVQLEGKSEVVLDLKCKNEYKKWDKDYIRVQVDIQLKVGTTDQIKNLIRSGRYTVKPVYRERKMFLGMPKFSGAAKTMKEEIAVTVYVPNSVKIQRI